MSHDLIDPAIVERFWAKVDKSGDCWLWTGGDRHVHGYGYFSTWAGNTRKRHLAHRLALAFSGNPPADGSVVRHQCDNPPCVNPAHLMTGTQAENIADAVERGRLNTSGLALGHVYELPPRPCRECGAQLEGGRNRLCPPCKKEARRDAVRRCKAKAKENAA